MARAIVKTKNTMPMITNLFSTPGPGTYNASFYFSVVNATATAGATYTNNSVTFTVRQTISGASILIANGNASPSTFGILTKTSGTGDNTITFTAFSAPIQLKVKMIGAGGGGGGAVNAAASAAGGGGAGGYLEKLINNPNKTYSYTVGTGGPGGNTSGTSGTAGTASTFDTLSAGGGGGGVGSTGIDPDAGGGAGGPVTGGDLNLAGGSGSAGIKADAGEGRGGDGGAGYFGGGGSGGHNGHFSAVNGPTVGSGGGGGGARLGAQAGASGANGLIIVEEYY